MTQSHTSFPIVDTDWQSMTAADRIRDERSVGAYTRDAKADLIHVRDKESARLSLPQPDDQVARLVDGGLLASPVGQQTANRLSHLGFRAADPGDFDQCTDQFQLRRESLRSIRIAISVFSCNSCASVP